MNGNGDGNGNGNVSKEFHMQCMQNTKEAVEELRRVSEKRLDAHADELHDISKLIERVIAVQEIQSKQLETSEKRLQMLEQQMSAQKELNASLKNQTQKPKAPIWREKWFYILITTGCILIVLLAGAAIGQNVLAQYLDYIK